MQKMSVLLISSMVVLFGCVPSLHELYTEETLVFEPGIAGRWQQEGDDAVWVFEGDAENKSYRLTIAEKGAKESRLTVHLVAVGGQRFFDFYHAEDADIEAGDWVKATLIPGHLFVRVEATEPNLVLWVMNPETVKKVLKERPELVKHERTDDRVVLTDGPEGLQAFLAAGLKIESFFGDPVRLVREAIPASGRP